MSRRVQNVFFALVFAASTVTQSLASVGSGTVSPRIADGLSTMATQALSAREICAQVRISETPGRVDPTISGLLDLEIQRHLNDGRLSPEEAIRRLERETTLSPEQMRTLEAEFQEDMVRGIEGKKSSLEMIPSDFKPPTGHERGVYPVLSQGGTNSVLDKVRLNGDHTTTVLAHGRFRLAKRDIKGNGERLLLAMAKNVKTVTGQDGRLLIDALRPTNLLLALAFSIKMVAPGVSQLLGISKEFNATDLIDKDFLALLNAAFAKVGLALTRAITVINDTVTLLLLGEYRNKSPLRKVVLSLVLGTGFNIAARIRATPDGETIIYNLEAGAFDKVKKYWTRYDWLLDEQSSKPGHHPLEKMVSGKYVPELIRLAAQELPKQTDLFRGWSNPSIYSRAYTVLSAPALSALAEIPLAGRLYNAIMRALLLRSTFATPYGLSMENVSAILADDPTPGLEHIDRFLIQRHIHSTLEERQALRRIAVAYVRRAVQCVEFPVCATLTSPLVPDAQTWEHELGIATEGSVIEKTPHFREWLNAGMIARLGAKRAAKVNFEFTPGGAVEGGAVAGALIAPSKPEDEAPPPIRQPAPRRVPIYSHFTAYAA